jgi:hypothetical protein
VEPVICSGMDYAFIFSPFRNRIKVTYFHGVCCLSTHAKRPNSCQRACKLFFLIIPTTPRSMVPSVCKFDFCTFRLHQAQTEHTAANPLPFTTLHDIILLIKHIDVDRLAILSHIREVPGSNTVRRPANLTEYFHVLQLSQRTAKIG